MLGVTFFGLLLTPVFYVLVRRLSARERAKIKAEADPQHDAIPAPEGHHA
jgi:hypothetical protein